MAHKPPHDTLEEANLPRLGLISVMREVPDDTRSGWTAPVMLGGLPGTITCRADPRFGAPHGLDNDVSAAVHTAYRLQPPGGSDVVRLSIADLMRYLIPKSTGGNYYAMVRESLERLANTRYEITANWFDATSRSQGRAIFPYFAHFQEIQTDDLLISGQPAVMLEITLNSYVRKNIDANHWIPLPSQVIAPLGNVTARALGRLFESLRRGAHDVHQISDTLDLSLEELRSAARILSGDARPSRLQRFLMPALSTLVSIGRLEKYGFSGTRSEPRLELKFRKDDETYDTLAYEQLVHAHMWPELARELAARHSRAEIEAVIQEARSRKGIVNIGAYIGKALKNGAGRQTAKPPEGQAAQPAPPAATPGSGPRAELTPHAQEPLPPTASRETAALRVLQTTCADRKVSAAHTRTLEQALQDGRLTSSDVTQLMTSKISVERLLERLDPPARLLS